MPNLKPPKEDTWAFQPIGSPFPENPVKVIGQQNMYVSLWYKHGKPIHGRAWNNGGVVECSFPYKTAELTGAKDLGGQIQVLQYKGDHRCLGYWYNWIKYSERFDKMDERQLLKCGDSLPILWKNRPQGALLGFLDNKTEIASFSHDKVAEQLQGAQLNDMLIIVRELNGGPPECDCSDCVKPEKKPEKLIMTYHWADFRTGDPFPPAKALRALGRSLVTLPGENPDQYVALWYQSGEPVMGRIWNDNGKIAACFSWGGHEYRSNIGSLQVLFELPEHVRGYDFDWRPFPEAAKFDKDKEWHPVHVNHHKGDISPGVLMVDGKEILGKVDVRNERASAGHGGQEKLLVGPAVHSCKVLCCKARPGQKFDW
ncbi:cytosolic motility protein domain-containing protein [Ditylenchus destructor]|uniref:Cytosolic motility protein domain-containing protein n=1 Tax=Ditylenchus destructor TaxID=166010 RepID=A0AAD4R9Z0_9BILA|nr:cytosolic motility protein domain-containing protein [Ditylenchus destructor]